ncbi:Cobalt-precorrin-3b C17-methyltransferase [Desulfovibrio sp. DV]|uniref:precorrin-3B C(17)-methyltransferase n=1 Tax=Desulfovibrio sp. DV TaxID=1844708 RepID=UPI00094B8883|nr:precorrin-3B C(17)-methyltransferase [Desulfovibrio sp. DV]OLN29646.1 Cobalt-precorrin-3b C17-methyltransferase [Desulfovibrio sp. DV]
MVGLGPGDPSLLAPMAQTALQEADMVVGYTAYIQLVPPPLLAGKTVAATGMTHEVARCRAALEAAAEGRRVVLVSSGDAGVYGMAGLALEMLAALGLDGHVTFTVVPGIPAVCAAAALLGAPLTHDFAVISLSDLLTPWPVIEQRLEAVFAADFVVALYNPRSRRRTGHLPAALACAARHRSPETPVGMVKSAFRPDQKIRVTPLAEADPAWADMLTLVIVGNSASRMAAGRILTPRGYAGKYDLGQ